MENILKVAGQSERFKNKVAFVSGASRGFGSVLVRMLALQGAITLINYRTHRGDAEAMVSELGPWNSQVYAVAGDVASAGDCRNMRLEVEARAGRIDLLVGNAFPAIPARGFLAQGGGEFMEFLERSVATIVHLFREMLPIVAREGVVVLVSTRYVRVPEKHFSHYVAAKSCLEGLMRSLALEFPNQTFVIARPPRMLTDQTNLVFDLSPPASAVTVAHELIGKLWPLNRAPNLLEWDLEGKPESGQ